MMPAALGAEQIGAPVADLNGCAIALVGPLPPPSGGMANQTLQLQKLLQENGAKVEMVRVNPPYKPAFIGQLKGVRALFRLLAYLLRVWRAAGNNDLFHVMANSGWSWHLFAAPVIWIAWMKHIPVVLNYRGGEAEAFFQKAWRTVEPSLRRCSVITVPSGFLCEVFEKRGFYAQVVPNILDLSRFQAKQPVATIAAPHLVVTRNLEAIYDVATSIRAFAKIAQPYPDARLTIAGSGPEESALKDLVAQLALHDSVTFTGRLSNEDIAALYQQADLMLNSSRVDNSPNSLIEALASGVPVVSSNVGGIPYLVETGKSALLVPANDPDALAEAALCVLNDTQLREQMVAEGAQLVRRFDKERVITQLAEQYRQVLV